MPLWTIGSFSISINSKYSAIKSLTKRLTSKCISGKRIRSLLLCLILSRIIQTAQSMALEKKQILDHSSSNVLVSMTQAGKRQLNFLSQLSLVTTNALHVGTQTTTLAVSAKRATSSSTQSAMSSVQLALTLMKSSIGASAARRRVRCAWDQTLRKTAQCATPDTLNLKMGATR